jgi:hypothetical protein
MRPPFISDRSNPVADLPCFAPRAYLSSVKKRRVQVANLYSVAGALVLAGHPYVGAALAGICYLAKTFAPLIAGRPKLRSGSRSEIVVSSAHGTAGKR